MEEHEHEHETIELVKRTGVDFFKVHIEIH